MLKRPDTQRTYNVMLRHVPVNHRYCGKRISITHHFEYVFVALVIQHGKSMCLIILS